MATVTITVGTQGQLYFTSTPGRTTFTDTVIAKDGVPVSSPVFTVTEIATGLFCLKYTPSSTGTYMIYAGGQITGYMEAVTKTLYSYLRNIEDEALGSWAWDKVAGTLQLVRQDGTALATFNVTDDSISASRELV